MEQQNEFQQNNKNNKIVLLMTLLSIFTTSIIVGGSVFLWQKSQTNVLRQEIQDLEKQKGEIVSETQSNKDQEKSIADNLKSISIKKSGDFNYFIYTDENGNENIIDKAPWDSDNWQKLKENGTIENITGIRSFLGAKFSPLENYILLTQTIYEGGNITNLYDIKNRKEINGIYGTTALEFTPDEKYLISCDYGRNFPTAKIYETTGFKEMYNLFGNVIGEGETQFYNGYRIKYCNWNNSTQKVRFYLENFNNPSESKELLYDIESGKLSK